jgi:hypothetical protein
VLAHVLEEELKRVGQDLRGVRGPGGLLRSSDCVGLIGIIGGIDGDCAIGKGRVVEVELERKRLELRGLDTAALLRVGEKSVNCRDVDRGGQRESFRSCSRRARACLERLSGSLSPLHRSLSATASCGTANAFRRERCRHSV